MLSEEEKKKREEVAKNIISGITGNSNIINTINYNKYNVKTNNDEEQSYVNKVKEANDIINSINPREDVPSPTINEEDKNKSQENAQKFIDLIDNNTIDSQTPVDTTDTKYGLGNIDLSNRPIVHNDDGSISTIRSISFEDESGKEVLIPTVSEDGRIMSNDEAIQQYYETGRYLGKFDSIDEANKYAEQLHNQQEQFYSKYEDNQQSQYEQTYSNDVKTENTPTYNRKNIENNIHEMSLANKKDTENASSIVDYNLQQQKEEKDSKNIFVKAGTWLKDLVGSIGIDVKNTATGLYKTAKEGIEERKETVENMTDKELTDASNKNKIFFNKIAPGTLVNNINNNNNNQKTKLIISDTIQDIARANANGLIDIVNNVLNFLSFGNLSKETIKKVPDFSVLQNSEKYGEYSSQEELTKSIQNDKKEDLQKLGVYNPSANTVADITTNIATFLLLKKAGLGSTSAMVASGTVDTLGKTGNVEEATKTAVSDYVFSKVLDSKLINEKLGNKVYNRTKNKIFEQFKNHEELLNPNTQAKIMNAVSSAVKTGVTTGVSRFTANELQAIGNYGVDANNKDVQKNILFDTIIWSSIYAGISGFSGMYAQFGVEESQVKNDVDAKKQLDNYYSLMELDPSKEYTLQDLDKQRKILVKKYHPDLAGNNTEQMALINNAYDEISNYMKTGKINKIVVKTENTNTAPKQSDIKQNEDGIIVTNNGRIYVNNDSILKDTVSNIAQTQVKPAITIMVNNSSNVTGLEQVQAIPFDVENSKLPDVAPAIYVTENGSINVIDTNSGTKLLTNANNAETAIDTVTKALQVGDNNVISKIKNEILKNNINVENTIGQVINSINTKTQENNGTNSNENSPENNLGSKLANYTANTNKDVQKANNIKNDIDNFSTQVDNVMNGTFPKRSMLTILSETPQPLKDIGLPNLPITMTQKHLNTIINESGSDKNANYHNLGTDLIKQLPEAISSPLDIVESNTKDDSIVLTTYLADKEDRTVVASIKIDGKGTINNIRINTNVMTSAYGRNNYETFMNKNLKEGKLLYDIDRGVIKKVTGARLQLPRSSNLTTKTNGSYITNSITPTPKIVNSENSVTNNNNYMQNTEKNTNSLDMVNQISNISMEDRTYENVGNKNVLPYAEEHPEISQDIKDMAANFMEDLANSLPGERYKAGETWTGQKRSTTEELANFKDSTGISWNKMGEILDDIYEGKGNYALAKKMEIELDKALSEGYKNIYGQNIMPNEDYLKKKGIIEGKDYLSIEENNNYVPDDDTRIFGMKKKNSNNLAKKSNIKYNSNGIQLGKREYISLKSAINTDSPNLSKGINYKFFNENFYMFDKLNFDNYKIISKISIDNNKKIIEAFRKELENGTIKETENIDSIMQEIKNARRSNNNNNVSSARRTTNKQVIGLYNNEGRQRGEIGQRRDSQESIRNKSGIENSKQSSFNLHKNNTSNNIKSMKKQSTSHQNGGLTKTEYDSQGNPISFKTAQFFKDSKVRDDKGKLMVMYHGTEANVGIPKEYWFNIFDIDKAGNHGNMLGNGFYFTSDRTHAEQYAHLKGNIYETYLNIKNPLELNHFSTGDLAYTIRNINPYIEADIYKKDGSIDGYKVRKYLLDNGYDGIHSGNTYVAFNSNQIKAITNSAPTSNNDIRYMRKTSTTGHQIIEKDNLGRMLSKQQQEYFKNSKVRDEKGNLKTVYHGTDTKFTVFSYEHLGKNGTANGKGFYLADDINVAKSYSDGKNLIEAYVDIEKPLSIGKTTMSENDYIKFLKTVNEKTNGGLFADYGDGEKILKNSKQYNEIVNQFRDEYAYGGDDVDLVLSILNSANITLEDGYRLLKQTTGYDGIIVESDYKNDGKTIPYTQYIPLTPEQIKNVDNTNPTNSSDIRYMKNTNGTSNTKSSTNIRQEKKPPETEDIITELERQKLIQKSKHNGEREDAYIEQAITEVMLKAKWDENIKPIGTTDIINFIEKSFGDKIEKGNFRQQAYAIYKENRDIIRTKSMKDIDSIVHEVFHRIYKDYNLKEHIEDLYPEVVTRKVFDLYSNLNEQDITNEGFAEMGRRYIVQKDYIEEHMPKTVAILEELKENNPELKRFLEVLTQRVQDYIYQAPWNRTKGSISYAPKKETIDFKESYTNAKNKLITNVLNQDYALEMATDFMGKGMGYINNYELNPNDNPVIQNALKQGIGDKIDSILKDGIYDLDTGKKLCDGIAKVGKILPNTEEQKNLSAYLTALRAMEASEKGKKTGIRYDDAKMTVEKFSKDKNLEEARIIYQKFQSTLLDQAKKAGLYSQKDIDLMKENWLNYATFYRVMDDSNKGSSLMKNPIKKFVGSERDIINPLESTIIMLGRIYPAIQRNITMKSFVDLGEVSSLGGVFYDIIPTPVKYSGTEHLEDFRRILERQGIDTDGLDLSKTYDLYFPDRRDNRKERITSYKVDGKEITLQFRDDEISKQLYDIFTGGYDKDVPNLAKKILSETAKVFRYGTTIVNPKFVVNNISSDTQQAATNAKGKFIPYADSIKGLADVIIARGMNIPKSLYDKLPVETLEKLNNSEYRDKVQKYYALFKQSGASGGTRTSLYSNRNQTSRMMADLLDSDYKELGLKKNKFKSVVDTLSIPSELSEEATRFGVFKKNLDYMQNEDSKDFINNLIDSAYNTRNATQDFSTGGKTIKKYSSYIPYLSAKIGSIENSRIIYKQLIGESAKEYKKQYTNDILKGVPEEEAKNKATKKIVDTVKKKVLMTALFTSVGFLLHKLYKDDKEYDEINQQKKYNNYYIKIGNSWVKVKKAQGEERLWVNLGEYLADLTSGKLKGKSLSTLGATIGNSIQDTGFSEDLSAFLPPLVSTIFEISSNYDFYYGNKIVPEYMKESYEPKDWYDENTSGLSKLIGQTFNIAPMYIDYFVKNGFGTTFYDLWKTPDDILGLTSNYPSSSKTSGGAFTVNPYSSSTSLNELYDRYNELKRKNGSGTLSEDEEKEYQTISDAKQNITDINKQIKEIKKDLTLSSSEKEKQILELQKQRTDTARNAMGKDLIDTNNETKIDSSKFYPSRDTLSKNNYTLTMTTEMKKEYEQLAYQQYQKYKSQGLYSEEYLENLETKCKDYAKNYMLQKYQNQLTKSK